MKNVLRLTRGQNGSRSLGFRSLLFFLFTLFFFLLLTGCGGGGGSSGETPHPDVTVTINPDNGASKTTVAIAYNGSLPATYFGAGSDVPAKTGYRFIGWNNGTDTIDNTTQFTQDTELVAQWVWQITVKFNLGEIDGTPVTGNPPPDATIDSNTKLGNKCVTPSLTGALADQYEFVGWFNNKRQYTGSVNVVTPEAEFTLTARWYLQGQLVLTQTPAVHPGSDFVEKYPPSAETTVKVNQRFYINGMFSNVEPNAGVLTAKWYRATTKEGAEAIVVGEIPENTDTPHNISLNYDNGFVETAVGIFWYWVEVTNYNENATPDFQEATQRTQNTLKVIVTN